MARSVSASLPASADLIVTTCTGSTLAVGATSICSTRVAIFWWSSADAETTRLLVGSLAVMTTGVLPGDGAGVDDDRYRS